MCCQTFNLRTFSLNVNDGESDHCRLNVKMCVWVQGFCKWLQHQGLCKAGLSPNFKGRKENLKNVCYVFSHNVERAMMSCLPGFEGSLSSSGSALPPPQTKIPINVLFVSLVLDISISRTANQQLHRHHANLSLPQTHKLCKLNKRIYGNWAQN